MKIWIFNHYSSTPDQPMTGAYYIAKALAQRGHEVTFFASSFNYYRHKEIRLKGWQLSRTEQFEGVTFFWIRTFPHTSRLWSRALNMFSYFLMTISLALLRNQRPDVVIGTCPHLLAVLAAYTVSRMKQSQFVFEVRDLWPQTFVDHGMMSESNVIVVLLRWLEKFLYKKASLIITVLPYMYEYLERIGIPKQKSTWIPNGIEPEAYKELAAELPSANKYHAFMYMGGHSNYQGLETILEAAKLIQNEGNEKVRFVLLGDGSEKKHLIQYARDLGLLNVEFKDAVPRSALPSQMKEADVFIYHIKDLNVLQYGISPNKLCDYLMSCRPVLCATGARNNPVEEAKAGITIAPEDAFAMAEAVRQFITMSAEEKKEMGNRGRAYAVLNYDVNRLASKLERCLHLSLN